MSKKDIPSRHSFMTSSQKEKLDGRKRTHETCKELVGVNRPGKSAQDRARQGR